MARAPSASPTSPSPWPTKSRRRSTGASGSQWGIEAAPGPWALAAYAPADQAEGAGEGERNEGGFARMLHERDPHDRGQPRGDRIDHGQHRRIVGRTSVAAPVEGGQDGRAAQ